MEILSNPQLTISENLLLLERGSDELLLANCTNLRPLYINKGRKYIVDFLKAASELGSYKKIVRSFPKDADLLNTLLDHKIIISAGQDKDDALSGSLAGSLDFGNRRNISLYLLLSQSCNMGCVYCFNGAETYQTDKNLRMSKEVAFRSVERCLDSIVSGGCLEVVFFGGEPLLNWPLAKEIITYCENTLKAKHPEKLIKYHLTSNLSIIPADLIEWAKRHNITFLCDVDGPEPVHNLCRPFKGWTGSHDIITKNIRQLVAAGLRVDLRATITALNQDHILETAEHHKAIGGRSSAFIPVTPVNSDEDIMAEELLPSPLTILKGMTKLYRSNIWKKSDLHPFNQYESRIMHGVRTAVGCGAPYGNTPVVDVGGDVYPCIYLVGVRRFYMGNIMSESYPDKDLLRWMYDYLHVDNTEECKPCPWRYICSGGCPLGRLTILNNPAVSDKVSTYCRHITCEYKKQLMELVLWEKAQETASRLLENNGVREELGTVDIRHC